MTFPKPSSYMKIQLWGYLHAETPIGHTQASDLNIHSYGDVLTGVIVGILEPVDDAEATDEDEAACSTTTCTPSVDDGVGVDTAPDDVELAESTEALNDCDGGAMLDWDIVIELDIDTSAISSIDAVCVVDGGAEDEEAEGNALSVVVAWAAFTTEFDIVEDDASDC